MNPFEIIEKIPTGDAVRIFERIGIVSLDDPYRRPGHIGFRFSARDGAGADGGAGVGGVSGTTVSSLVACHVRYSGRMNLRGPQLLCARNAIGVRPVG